MRRFFLTYSLLFFFMSLLEAQVTVDPPILENVTVTAQGYVDINWTYAEPDSIDGFMIYYLDPTLDPAPSIYIATVEDSFATSYTDRSRKATTQSVPYTVAAYREVNDTIISSELTKPHFTIYLEEDWKKCQDMIQLNWNRYVGWGNDSIYYNIYENNVLIDKTKDTVYVNYDAENNVQYQYTIVAVNMVSGLTSKSNIVVQRTTFPTPAEFINADFASVNGETINLSFTMGGGYSLDYEYVLVAKLPLSETFADTLLDGLVYKQNIEYDYLVADVQQQYQFKLLEIDECGRLANESNISGNIVLSGEKQENIVNLNWTEYVDWLGDVDNYAVYRNSGDGFDEISSTSGFSYSDNIDGIIADKEVISVLYYIKANEGETNPYINEPQDSRSNVIEIFLETELEFPSGITPNGDGMNDIFHPINLNFVPTDYHLIVFDRWGKRVFETKQVSEGWDGRFSSGKSVSEGVYNFYVTYRNAEGVESSQTGIVTVIYP